MKVLHRGGAMTALWTPVPCTEKLHCGSTTTAPTVIATTTCRTTTHISTCSCLGHHPVGALGAQQHGQAQWLHGDRLQDPGHSPRPVLSCRWQQFLRYSRPLVPPQTYCKCCGAQAHGQLSTNATKPAK